MVILPEFYKKKVGRSDVETGSEVHDDAKRQSLFFFSTPKSRNPAFIYLFNKSSVFCDLKCHLHKMNRYFSKHLGTWREGL